jgi:hypothetical protein
VEHVWIVGGLYVQSDKAILLAQHVRPTPTSGNKDASDDAAFAYEIVGTSVMVVGGANLPVDQWQVTSKKFPGTSATQNWYSGIALVDGSKHIATSTEEDVYLIGTSGKPMSLDGSMQTLARTSVGSLLDFDFTSTQVWSTLADGGTAWQPLSSPAVGSVQLAPLFSPAMSELTLMYSPQLQAWYTAWLDSASAQLVLRFAPHPTGPWSVLPVFDVPAPWDSTGKFHAYAAKVHPALSKQSNELVVSFVTNPRVGLPEVGSHRDASMHTYRPAFVRVQLYSDLPYSRHARPDCASCKHLPADPSIYGHYAGLDCPCLSSAMAPAGAAATADPPVRDEVRFPEGPFDLLDPPGSSASASASGGIDSADYLQLMKDLVLNRHYRERPALIDGHDHPKFEDALTMIGSRRLDNLHALLQAAVHLGVEGDFIETGAWRGGACLFAASFFKAYHQERKVPDG